MKIAGYACLFLIAAISFSGCDSSYGDRFVRHEIKDFHADYNDEKFADLYAAADEEMHQKGSEQQFTNFLATLHQQLGKAVSSRNSAWDTRVTKDRREIMLIQNTRFERGSGKETFTYVLVKGHAVLLGYHVKANDTPAGR